MNKKQSNSIENFEMEDEKIKISIVVGLMVGLITHQFLVGNLIGILYSIGLTLISIFIVVTLIFLLKSKTIAMETDR